MSNSSTTIKVQGETYIGKHRSWYRHNTSFPSWDHDELPIPMAIVTIEHRPVGPLQVHVNTLVVSVAPKSFDQWRDCNNMYDSICLIGLSNPVVTVVPSVEFFGVF